MAFLAQRAQLRGSAVLFQRRFSEEGLCLVSPHAALSPEYKTISKNINI